MDPALYVYALAVTAVGFVICCAVGIAYCLGKVLRGFWDALFPGPPRALPPHPHPNEPLVSARHR